jgi:hypothetical protein
MKDKTKLTRAEKKLLGKLSTWTTDDDKKVRYEAWSRWNPPAQ